MHVSLRGEANLLLYSTARGIQADRRQRGRIVTILERNRVHIYHKGCRQSCSQATCVALALAGPSQWCRNKEVAGRRTVGRYACATLTNTVPRLIPSPHTVHNYTAVWPHKRDVSIKMDDFSNEKCENEKRIAWNVWRKSIESLARGWKHKSIRRRQQLWNRRVQTWLSVSLVNEMEGRSNTEGGERDKTVYTSAEEALAKWFLL